VRILLFRILVKSAELSYQYQTYNNQNTFFFVVIFLTMESLKLQHFHYARKGNSMAKAPVFKCFEEFNENSDQTKWESYSAQLEKVKKLQKQIRDLKKFSTVGNTKEK
jgi:hypothetical protein